MAAIYVLRNGRPEKLMVETGITDGSFTEVKEGALKPGDLLVVGNESSGRAANAGLQPPPGMGGFRGPGGGRRR
jgi:HlyD family secretion protein